MPLKPHEAPDEGGCTGWGCLGCLATFVVSTALLLWLIHFALESGIPYQP